MPFNQQLPRAALALFALLALGCQGADPMTSAHQHAANPVTAQVSGAIKSEVARLRAIIAPLHTLEAAQDAGFNELTSPCVASPAGGMGFHWADPTRVDAVAQWDEPEVLVFAPSPDQADEVRLGAVEYIVPKSLSPTAPSLFGRTFVEGGPGNTLWTLHVWIGIANPDGLFADWNPRVSCP